MAARTTVTVNDRETTPVAHNFVPAGDNESGLAIFREPGVVFAADSILSLGLRGLKGNGRLRPYARLYLPIYQTETVNGIASQKFVDSCIVEISASYGRTTTLQQRKNAIGMAYNLLAPAQTLLDKLFTQNDPIW